MLKKGVILTFYDFGNHFCNSQPQAREKAEKEGFKVSIAKTSFKANTKALAENEGEGLAKVKRKT